VSGQLHFHVLAKLYQHSERLIPLVFLLLFYFEVVEVELAGLVAEVEDGHVESVGEIQTEVVALVYRWTNKLQLGLD